MYRGTRTNILEYNVYSVHSFTDHSDYFVVSSNFSTKPKKVDTQARVVLPYQQLGTEQTTELAYTWFRGLRGYTSGFDSKITFGNASRPQCLTEYQRGLSTARISCGAMTVFLPGIVSGNFTGFISPGTSVLTLQISPF